MAKVNFTELATEAKSMIGKLSEYHSQISEMMKTQKSRGLATVESSLRNAVDHLDRLPDAIDKAQFTSGKQIAKKKSRLVKPTTTAVKQLVAK